MAPPCGVTIRCHGRPAATSASCTGGRRCRRGSISSGWCRTGRGTSPSRRRRICAACSWCHSPSGSGRSLLVQTVEGRTGPPAEGGGAGGPVEVLLAPLECPVGRQRLDVAAQVRQLDEPHRGLRRREV